MTTKEKERAWISGDKKWDLEQMEYLRRKNIELRETINYNIAAIEIIARKYKTTK